MRHSAALSSRQGVAYGLLGLPLAFVALPLYVLLPNRYAREFSMPLATLGTVLLAARLFDAVIDPLLGRLSDRLFARSTGAVLGTGAVAALVLAAGLIGLFFPVVSSQGALVVWVMACLLVTSTAYSQLGISHQSWGARLGGNELQRGRIVAWREGAGLIGVVLACVLPQLFGLPTMLGVFVVTLALGWQAWSHSPAPVPASPSASDGLVSSLWRPWRCAPFRRLLVVFVLNGIASAVPATLLLFFIQDRLQAPDSEQPLFLAAYFVCAALSIPLWLKAVSRLGLARTWLVGMLLSIVVFAGVAGLDTGDTTAFLLVCALSGVALGTDLALPSALLAGVVAQQGDHGQHEGAYFGWWNFATKLNLALAAGLSLPLLGGSGYAPGTRDPDALHMLSLAYGVLPCGLKLLAALALYYLIIRRAQAGPLLIPGGIS